MSDIQKALLDFDSTIKAKPNLTNEELMAKFPEFNNDAKLLQSAHDYSATLNSGKYNTHMEINSKFPEFFEMPTPMGVPIPKSFRTKQPSVKADMTENAPIPKEQAYQEPYKMPLMYGNEKTIKPDPKTGAFTPEIAAGMRGEVNPNQPKPEDPKNSFVFDLVEKFNQGGANVGKNSAGFLQKLYGGLKNIPIPGAEWYYGKAEDAMGAISNYFGETEKEMQSITNRYKGKDFSDLASEGKYSEAMGDIMLNATQSLPQSLQIMFMGPAGVAMGAAQMQNEQYDQLEGKDMSEAARVTNSILNAAIQTGTEYMNTIPMGKLIKGLAGNIGTKEATTLLENGTRTWLQKMFKRYGVYLSPIDEGIEEFVSQIGTNTVDYLTGAKNEFTPFEGAGKSFVYGAGGGLQFSAVGVPMQIASNVKAKQQYKLADSSLSDILITGGFNPQESTEIKQSLLSTTGKDRNNAVVEIIKLMPNAIVEEDGAYKIKPEIEKAFVDFYNSSDNLQESSRKHEKRIQEETKRQNEGTLEYQREQEITQAQQEAQDLITRHINPDMDALVTVKVKGVTQTLAAKKIVFKEDGTIDDVNSDQTLYHYNFDENGEMIMNENGTPSTTPFSIGDITEMGENIPREQAIQEAVVTQAAPIQARHANEDVRVYNPDEFVRLKNGLRGYISGTDENGNYKIKDESGNELPISVEPRAIINEDNIVGIKPGETVNYIDPADGQTKQGTIQFDKKLRLDGNVIINDSEEIPIVNIQPIKKAAETPINEGTQAVNTDKTTIPDELPPPPANLMNDGNGNITEIAPVIYPTKKDGTIDFEAMTDEQNFTYSKEQFGEKEAINDLNNTLIAVNKQLTSIKKKIDGSPDMAKKNKLRLEEKTLRERYRTLLQIKEQNSAPVEFKPVIKTTTESGVVGTTIKERWDNSNKVQGWDDTITLPNGEVINGHWVLAGANAVTPSHNSETYQPSEGFPQTPEGRNVNDNDYTNKKAEVELKAADFDSRAIDNPIVIKDGVVVSGNNRTMSGQIAAKQGTDTKYVEGLNTKGKKYGFNQEQIDSVENPRIYFEVTDELPLNVDTFAKFNARNEKSKSSTEKAIIATKRNDEALIGRIIPVIDTYDSLADFYKSEPAQTEVLKHLLDSGIINQNEVPELFEKNNFTINGRNYLEAVIIGNVMNEDQIKVLNLDGMMQYRQKIVKAIVPLLQNSKLEESLLPELNEAVLHIYKAGGNLSDYFSQINMFENEQFDENVVLLATVLRRKESEFKQFIVEINNILKNQTIDMFLGRVKTKQDVYDEFKDTFSTEERSFYNNSQRNKEVNSNTPSSPELIQSGGNEIVPNSNTKEVTLFKKGEGGTKGLFQDKDGNLYKSLVRTYLAFEDGVAVRKESEGISDEYDILKALQGNPRIPIVGEKVETSEGTAFEIEKLDEVESLTFDEYEQVRDILNDLNNQGYFVNDTVTVMRRPATGQLVIVDFSAGRYDTKLIGNVTFSDLAFTSRLRSMMSEADQQKATAKREQEEIDMWNEIEAKQEKKKQSAVDQQIQSQDINTNPTEAQKEAGNYKKGHVVIQDIDITVENPKGSVRSGVDEDGKAWEHEMNSHYGYFKGTVGKDGDHVDTFIGNNPESKQVFVIDQVNPKSGKFDESKVMIGFEGAEQAKAAYLENYDKDWKGFYAITEVGVDDFKTWLYDGKKQHKPFAEYKDTPEPHQQLSEIHIKNGDVVTYQGKQYTVNGLYADGLSVDLEDAKGKTIHEEVPVSELGIEYNPEPKVDNKQEIKNKIKATESELKELWSNGKTLSFNGENYYVHKMNAGNYILSKELMFDENKGIPDPIYLKKENGFYVFDDLRNDSGELNQSEQPLEKVDISKFDTYEDAVNWIEEKSKEYGGKNKFLSSEEYKNAYPTILELQKNEVSKYATEAQSALTESGLKEGDKVFYDFVSPYMNIENYSGIVELKNGIPYVRLDKGQKTLSGKTSIAWHKGFKKVDTSTPKVDSNLDSSKIKEITDRNNALLTKQLADLNLRLEDAKKEKSRLAKKVGKESQGTMFEEEPQAGEQVSLFDVPVDVSKDNLDRIITDQNNVIKAIEGEIEKAKLENVNRINGEIEALGQGKLDHIGDTNEKISSENKLPEQAVKQPWEMTREEWNNPTNHKLIDKFTINHYRGKGGLSDAWAISTFLSENKLPSFQELLNLSDKEKAKINAKFKESDYSKFGSFDEFHKQAIQQALSEGKQVPENVLADYPELKAEVKPTKLENEINELKEKGKSIDAKMIDTLVANGYDRALLESSETEITKAWNEYVSKPKAEVKPEVKEEKPIETPISKERKIVGVFNGALPQNKTYKMVESFYAGEGNYQACENCGKPITNVGVIENEDGVKHHVGLDCASTLSGIKDGDKLTDAEENFRIAKNIRQGLKKAQLKNPNAKITSVIHPGGYVEIELIENGRWLFRSTQGNFDFIDKYLPEITKTISNKDKIGFVPKYNENTDFGFPTKGSIESDINFSIDGKDVTIKKTGSFESNITITENGKQILTVNRPEIRLSSLKNEVAYKLNTIDFENYSNIKNAEAKTTATLDSLTAGEYSKAKTEQEKVKLQNEAYRTLKEKLGEKKAQKYFDEVERLFKGVEILEYRANGVVTLEDGKKIFNALSDMDLKNWRIGFKNEIDAKQEDLPIKSDTELTFPKERVVRAWQHAHLSPYNTAKVEENSWNDSANKLTETIKQYIPDITEEELNAFVDKYKSDYLKERENVWKAAENTVSSAVAGRDKFNKKQADQRGSSLDRAETSFESWNKKEVQRIEDELGITLKKTEEKQKQIEAKEDKKQLIKEAKVKAWKNLKVGDTLDIGNTNGNPIITKKNKFSVETGAGTTWTLKEVYGIDHKEAQEIMNKQIEPKTREILDSLTGGEFSKANSLSFIPESFTVQSFNEFEKQFNNGEITLAAYKKAFEVLRGSKDAIIAELSTKTKDELIKSLNSWSRYGVQSEKKDRIVNAIYDDMLMTFTFGSIEYDFSTTTDVAISRKVAKATQTDIDNHVKEVQKQRDDYKKRLEEFKKALTNPETLPEFRIFIDKNGIDKLSLEQKAKYDELVSDRTQEIRKKNQETQAQISKVEGVSMSDVIESKHTKTGQPLFVVKLNDRVDKDTYYELNSKAKKLGGSYSSYNKDGAIPGFQFKSREDAEKFKGLETENVSTINETTQEDKIQSRVSKLRENANKMIEAADTELNRERLTNTSKRASEAGRMDDRANEQKRIAQTMLNIADAIDRGDVKLLDGINAKTHIQLLDSLIQQAQNAELNVKYPEYREKLKHQGEPATLETIEHLRGGYYPSIYAPRLKDLVSQSLDKTGVKRIAAQWEKITSKLGDNGSYQLKSDKDVQELQEMLDASKENYFFDQIKESIANHKRLKVMGIENDSMLRAALREYIQYRGVKGAVDKVKQLERNLVGKNVGIDFFPTPKKVVSEMLDYADIQEGMSVLEPSAGNGNIADAIKEQGIKPDVIEIANPLREVLDAKGYNLVGDDFMAFSGRKYDRIVMNPPFGTSADIDHVLHAYDLLNPNGKVVAVMSESTFFRNDAKSVKFREFLENNGSEIIDVEAGAFNDKTLLNTTGVKTRIVVIDKQEGENGMLFQFNSDEIIKNNVPLRQDYATLEEKYIDRVSLVEQIEDSFGFKTSIVPVDRQDFISKILNRGKLGNDVKGLILEGRIGGIAINGDVIINAMDANTEKALATTILHENVHIIVNENFNDKDINSIKKNIPELEKQYLNEKEIELYNNDTKANEIVTYATQSLLSNNSIEEIVSGNVDYSEIPESILPQVQKIINIIQDENNVYHTRRNSRTSELNRRGVQRTSTTNRIGTETGNRGNDARTNASGSKELKATINIDGVERPTTNSTGKPIHSTEEGIRNFWRWFGDSKVVDESGRPLVVNHGSRDEFTTFDKQFSGKSNSLAVVGFWFSDVKDFGERFADNSWGGSSNVPVIYNTFLKLENPFIYESSDYSKELDSIDAEIYELKREKQKLENSIYIWDYNAIEAMYIAKTTGFKDKEIEDYYRNRSDESSKAIDNGFKLRELSDKINKLQSEYYDKLYTDSYQKFKTDVYKIAGMTSKDANIGGLGMAIRNKDKVVEEYVSGLKEKGYDGIIIKNTSFDKNAAGGIENNQYVAFDNTQIKSATGNIGSFEENNPNINLQIIGERGATSLDKAEEATKKEFDSWFNDSKIVNENGEPLVVYHGSPTEGIKSFNKELAGTQNGNLIYGKGIYFTEDKPYADQYRKNNGELYQANLSIKNPLIIKEGEDISKYDLSKYDGVIVTSYNLRKGKDTMKEIVVFNPSQIKIIDPSLKAEEATTRLDNLRVAKEMEKGLSENSKVKETVYHGSYENYDLFDKTKLGKYSNAKSAKEGFFFTDKIDLASDFAYDSARSFGKYSKKQILEQVQKANFEKVNEFVTSEIKNQYDFEAYNSINDYLEQNGKISSIEPDENEYKNAINELASEYLYEGISDSETSNEFKRIFDKLEIGVGYIHKVKLNLENPLIVDKNIDFEDGDGLTNYIETAKKNGNDGVIFNSVRETIIGGSKVTKQYVVFEPTQIIKQFTPQEIRIATGWEKGVDGLWRYEVPDGKVNDNHYSDLLERKFNEDIKSGLINATTLGELYDSKELYNAFPELENMQVILYEDDKGEGRASYNPDEKTIYIYNPLSLKSIEGRDSNLIHEIQHAIQQIEGFAVGGNPDIAWEKSKEFIIDKVKNLKGWKDILAKEEWMWKPESLRSLEVEKNQYLSDYAAKRLSEDGTTRGYKFDQYLKLAGETEARNASTRMNFTAEERRQRLLSETADVAPEDQIVIMEGMGVSNSTPPTTVTTLAAQVGEILPEKIRDELDRKIGLGKGKTSFRIQEAYQDSYLAVKEFQEVLKRNGVKITPLNDYYMRVTAIGGMNDAQMNAYEQRFNLPIMREVNKMEKISSYRDIENYMMSKHGLERNEFMLNQEAEKMADKNLKYPSKKTLEDDVDGSVMDEYNATRQQYIEENIQRLEGKDYSGITAIEEETGKTAQEIIDEFESKHDVTKFWELINKATHNALNTQFDNGLINEGILEELKARYKYYIPLRGFDKEIAEDKYDYSPDMGTHFVAPLIKANGRTSRPEMPFAYIFQMNHSAITQGNKNNLNQIWVRLARLDKSKSLILKQAWYKKAGETDEGLPIWEVQSPEWSADPKQYGLNIEKFEETMLELQEKGEATQKRGKLNIGLFVKPKQAAQHELHVYENGVENVVYFNVNPAVARAISGDNKFESNSGFFKLASLINRQMAANFTSRNPIFMVTNFQRDVTYATTTLGVKEGVLYQVQFVKNIPMAVKAMTNMIAGKGNIHDKYDQYATEFILNGGKTGYTQIVEIKDIQKRIEKEIKSGKPNDPSVVFKAFELGNAIAENTTRLATYITSRESGRGIYESISNAKEVTVNFNRSGSGALGADFFRKNFLFFNVAVQSVANSIGLGKHPGRLAGLLASFVASGILTPLLIRLLGGDDAEEAYNNLSDWDRQNNWCIWTGDGFVKWALPQQLRVFHALGDNMYRFSKGKLTGTELAVNTLLGVTDLLPLNPLGAAKAEGKEWKMLTNIVTPDYLKPLEQLALNITYTGGTAYNEFAYKADPGYVQASKNKKGEPYAPAILVWAAKQVDKMAGGNGVRPGELFGIKTSPNPDQINHLMRGYMGGLYTIFIKSVDSGDKLIEGKPLKMRDTPFSALYTSKDDIKESNAGMRKEYNEIKNAVKDEKHYLNNYKNGAIDLYRKGEDPLTIAQYQTEMVNISTAKFNNLSNVIKVIETIEGKLDDVENPDEMQILANELKKYVIKIDETKTQKELDAITKEMEDKYQ